MINYEFARRMPALVLSGLFLIVAWGFTGPDQPKWKGSIIKEGNVIVIKNPKEPLYRMPVLEVREDLTLGDPEATGQNALGKIRTFALDEAANIYVLDDVDFLIKVFDKTGKFIRTIGRKGQGPGELDIPQTLSINRTANEIAVFQLSRRISFFKLDGTFLRQLSTKDIDAARGRVDSAGNILFDDRIMDPEKPMVELKKFGPDLTPIATLVKSPMPSPEKYNPFIALPSWSIDRDNNVVYGDPISYEIQVFAANTNKLIKRILGTYKAVPISEDEKKDEMKGAPPEVKFDFPKYHPAIARFFLDDKGHIIVQTWEKNSDGKYIHDIFDADGRWIGQIALRQWGATIQNGKYYSLEEDKDGYRSIKRYAVTWKIK